MLSPAPPTLLPQLDNSNSRGSHTSVLSNSVSSHGSSSDLSTSSSSSVSSSSSGASSDSEECELDSSTQAQVLALNNIDYQSFNFPHASSKHTSYQPPPILFAANSNRINTASNNSNSSTQTINNNKITTNLLN